MSENSAKFHDEGKHRKAKCRPKGRTTRYKILRLKRNGDSADKTISTKLIYINNSNESLHALFSSEEGCRAWPGLGVKVITIQSQTSEPRPS